MNIALFSGNDTIMGGYFIRMHRGMRMTKALLTIVYSVGFNTMSLNSKLSTVVSYIQDNKDLERIYILLKLILPCLQVIFIACSNKSRTDKVFYYSIMTKISIIKSSYDLYNKKTSPSILLIISKYMEFIRQ